MVDLHWRLSKPFLPAILKAVVHRRVGVMTPERIQSWTTETDLMQLIFQQRMWFM